jgi:hypothetical protein
MKKRSKETNKGKKNDEKVEPLGKNKSYETRECNRERMKGKGKQKREKRLI